MICGMVAGLRMVEGIQRQGKRLVSYKAPQIVRTRLCCCRHLKLEDPCLKNPLSASACTVSQDGLHSPSRKVYSVDGDQAKCGQRPHAAGIMHEN